MDFKSLIYGSPMWVVILVGIIYAALVVASIVIIWRCLSK